MELNERAMRLSDRFAADADGLRISVATVAGARIIDAGIQAPGGFAAGLALARVCMADLAHVALQPGPIVHVVTDHPVAACLASQYAGWQVQADKYFAMGSGPMRATYGKELLFDDIGLREDSHCAVGVLETRKLPTPAVIEYFTDKLQLPAEQLTLWVAPTGSIAGTSQVVARSVETCLHKLHELKFDLTTIISGFGTAPVPPVTTDDLVALGWTNDAILYGGQVQLYLRADDDVICEVGARVPSTASPAYGTPFGELFEASGRDFYKMDPHLFAPAQVVFHNMTTGHSFSFGKCAPEVMRRSFGWAE